MKRLKVGIIGCGTIGTAVAGQIVRKFRTRVQIAGLCDRDTQKAARLARSLRLNVPVLGWREIVRRSDLIVEAASASVSAVIAEEGLRQGKQVMVMSVGGLLRADLAKLQKYTGKLWVPSGAVAGIDAVQAAAQAGLKSVTLRTRKPPAGLKDAPYFQRRRFPVLRGKKEVCVFRGTAREAVRFFPQNINVAAVLSLAGIGAARTRVEIWTSRAYKSNRHEIIAEGRAGRVETVTDNVPAPANPKTSALAYYSALAVLEKILSTVRIGT